MKIKFKYLFDNVSTPTTLILDNVKSVIIGHGGVDITRDGYYSECYILDRMSNIIIWEDEQ